MSHRPPAFRPLRRALTTALALTLLGSAVPAGAAEVAFVGEPFLIAQQPQAATPPGLTWLPAAGADRPAGFLAVGTEAPHPGKGEGSNIVRRFVPENPGAAPILPLVLAGPGRFAQVDVAAGHDGGAAVSFADDSPLCYGGLLLDASLEIDAELQPAGGSGTCSARSLESALLPDGRLVVVYGVSNVRPAYLEGRFFAFDGSALGEPFTISEEGVADLFIREVATVPDGFLVFFVRRLQGLLHPLGPHELGVQRFGSQGQPLGEPIVLRQAPSRIEELMLAPVPGGLAAAWFEVVVSEDGLLGDAAFGRRLRFDGVPAGPVRPLLSELGQLGISDVALHPGPGDTVLFSWREIDFGKTKLLAQPLTGDLAPAGEAVTLLSPPLGFTLAVGPTGNGLLAWDEPDGSLLARRLAVTAECTSETVLCLQGGRFEVSVDWADFEGNAGPGRRVPVASDDSGLFWFFDPDNWEMLVKVLDGCPVNGHFWVFSAAATNVEYTLTVSDLVANQTRVFRNDLGDTARALTVTNAFPTCGTGGD